ncbi:vWA domain-containing protein [Catellatospora vulcania]|uniref:vWA domain-containing protein n=1 Tax=Catellatospora vulcania TaxID=1460450 RepID=UPI0018AFF5E6|nr:VWA domain-containing protein [Catellatospora vulcania]
MHITAHLDVDVVAVETEDQLSVLIELTAPPAPAAAGPRPPSTLQVVLDRSGSMSGARLEGAKTALISLVDRLDPQDNFGLVAFDDRVEVTVPAGKLTDKLAVKRAIAELQARGNTDLSAGYLRGLQEAKRVAGAGGARLLLVSDGHANAGVTDPAALGGVAAKAYADKVTSTTLGFGLGYDERLLSAIARGGVGNELFAEEADTASALIAGEVEGLLSQTAQAASLQITLSPQVRAVRIVNDLPVTATGNTVLAELGGFYADETRKLLLVFDIPAIAALGLAQVATCEFTWVELPSLTQHTVTVPLHVNVVPGDQAAGRVPDPVVRTELVYLQVQEAKRLASRHLSAGASDAALAEIRRAQGAVTDALAAAPPNLRADLDEEVSSLNYLAQQTEQGMIARAAKYSSSDSSYKSRSRGRTLPPTTGGYTNEPPNAAPPTSGRS